MASGVAVFLNLVPLSLKLDIGECVLTPNALAEVSKAFQSCDPTAKHNDVTTLRHDPGVTNEVVWIVEQQFLADLKSHTLSNSPKPIYALLSPLSVTRLL